MAETKIIYHIDEEETPYLVKLCAPPDKVTLADFKNVLNNRPVNSYKFFFKSMDQDFGVVKEEISDDNAKLPCFNGRVVSWLVLAESAHSDGGSQCTESHPELPPPLERTGGIGDSRPPSFHANAVSSRDGLDTETGTESLLSHRRERERERARRRARETEQRTARDSAMGYDSASVMSSELESSSFVDSEEDEDASRLSSSTEQSSSSHLMRRHKRRRRRHKVAKIDRSSSFSSITDSTMSLNIITVTLNMEKYNFLGISIVGQSNDRGDGGIYIGSIMKGGAVAADGRIEPGDMLLQVNDVNFENMSNDDAVRILREIVSKTGPISLTVAKCWDPSPRSYFTIPRAEPVRPIDPAAWISHTTALTGPYPHYVLPVSHSSKLLSRPAEFDDLPLSVSKTDMATIVKVMQLPDSGLEIRDRMWLKITIANAVIGADVVDWLYSRVEGFKDRRDARKYASSLLKHGYLRHTVNKITFSEQCYYTFGDLCQNMASLNLNEGSSGGGSEQDTLAPLPPPSNPWPLGGQPFPYPPFPSAPPSFPPGYSDPCHSFHSGSAGSQHSEADGTPQSWACQHLTSHVITNHQTSSLSIGCGTILCFHCGWRGDSVCALGESGRRGEWAAVVVWLWCTFETGQMMDSFTCPSLQFGVVVLSDSRRTETMKNGHEILKEEVESQDTGGTDRGRSCTTEPSAVGLIEEGGGVGMFDFAPAWYTSISTPPPPPRLTSLRRDTNLL
ncbi:putative segment polarity protein dishevelled -like DVL-1 [Scophthalmus maximus]|uniref:Putative segment polarity protein dishevelled-like DVL-1 n=1 Tax=Scophthalmus maximus TaxID=52904 RepID=A0A2U9C181_SCOMX|nr:putative segment polarity protein dishevelled -like DVL-1 [Scophthalmus maximus]